MKVKNKNRMYIGAVTGLLIAAFVLPTPLSRKAKTLIRGSLTPAERGISGLTQQAGSSIGGLGGSMSKNRELTHELVRLQAELNRLREVEEENIRLMNALDFHLSSEFSMVPCNVISRSINGWWKTVRIGKGSSDGIKINHAVISPDGLVGKTMSVSKNTGQVLLISDPAFRVSAKVQPANSFGLVRGLGTNLKGQPLARIDFIDKNSKIRVGDTVVTSGLSGSKNVFPKGVHIGRIVKVAKDDSGLYQYADIAPRATTSLLEYIFVVSPDNNAMRGHL